MNTANTDIAIETNVAPEQSASGIKSLLIKALATDASTPSIFLRISLAVAMWPHGAQKLLGWYGGYGFEGTMGFFTQQMGIPTPFALGAILVEFFAPILLVLGLGTRVAALSLAVVMAVAMFMVQLPNGFFMNWFGNQAGEGIQFSLLFIGTAIALIIGGGGKFSADKAIATSLQK
ncbi:MAG: DoxX family protein [Opitutales bacterium]